MLSQIKHVFNSAPIKSAGFFYALRKNNESKGKPEKIGRDSLDIFNAAGRDEKGTDCPTQK